VEKLCDLCNITVNKNAVFGDSSALAPGGVRIGKNFCILELVLF
jgi:glycine hydroxymethyltransferase